MKGFATSLILAACISSIFITYLFADTTAYIPNEGDDNIQRVFVSDESNFTEVDACTGPYGAAVTPDGDRLVITCPGDNTASVIPTANFLNTSAQLDVSLGTGHGPRGVAIESQGIYAYVTNYNNNTVDEIIISSGGVTDTFNVGTGPWGIAATYDSVDATSKVYVANHDADSISVISDSGVDTINSVGGGPIGVALTPDGAFLYVANYDDDTVVVIDTSDLSIDDTIGVGDGPWGVAMGDDGAFVFVTNSLADTVSVIDVGSRSVSGTYGVGGQPMGVAAPANGEFAYVVNQAGNAISKVTTSGTVTTIGSGELNAALALGTFMGGEPPNAPTSLEATMESESEIIINWTDNSSDELGFKIERREDSDDGYVQVAKVGEDVNEFTDTGLTRETIYHYRVRAFNEASDSDYSSSSNATTDDSQFSWCFINSLTGQ